MSEETISINDLKPYQRVGDYVLVPIIPSDGLLVSMALRHDHGLGCPGYYDQIFFHDEINPVSHQQRLENTVSHMRQLHEEIVGTGFYQPSKEDAYAKSLRTDG